MKNTRKQIMKIMLSIVLVLTVSNANIGNITRANNKNLTFSDVQADHEFYDYVMYLAQNDITTGYTTGKKAGSFGINEKLTRRHAAMFITRALGFKDEDLEYRQAFMDVSASDSGAGNIQKAFDLGLIKGYPNNDGSSNFRPNANLLRSQFSKITALAYNLKPDKNKPITLPDIEKSSEFEHIKALLDNNVVTGDSKAGKFFPNNTVTRGQVSKFIYNAEKVELTPYTRLLSLEGLPGGRVIVDGYEYQMTFDDIISGNLASSIASNMRPQLLKKKITVKAVDNLTLEFTKENSKIFEVRYTFGSGEVKPHIVEVSIKGPGLGKVIVDDYEYQITKLDVDSANIANTVAKNMELDLAKKEITVKALDPDTLEFTRKNGKFFQAKYIAGDINPYVVQVSLLNIPGGKIVVDNYQYQPTVADYFTANPASSIASNMRYALSKKDIKVEAINITTLEFTRDDGREFTAEHISPLSQ